MTTSTHLHIRPARPADREAVVAMVATVWGGDDYVPYVWDEWLADPSGPLLVGELAGQPVAIAKLSELGPAEDWFHGLRVDPKQRGKGFGRAMLRRCVELSRERGAYTLRYLTDEDNPTMHRMGEALGFDLVYAPLWYAAPAAPGVPSATALPPTRLDALMVELERSELLAKTAGMYFHDWRILDLTAARLREHLEHGEILALPGEDAWAIVLPRDEGGVWLAHIEGQVGAVERLGAAIRTGSGPSDQYARALLPPDAACIPALLAAGFAPTEFLMRVYQILDSPLRGTRF